MAKIVEEPCLAVCEDLYDKNILTYWSSANKEAPDRAYVLIRYESFDENNKKIADDLLSRGVLRDNYQMESGNSAEEYGKALYLGIDTNPNMPVQEISDRLCQIASEFALQDIKYNVYTPQYLIESNPFFPKSQRSEWAFPDLEHAILGDKLGDNYHPENKRIYDSIKFKFFGKKAQDISSEEMQQVADEAGWIYNKEDNRLYRDKETLRRHNEYVEQHAPSQNNQTFQQKMQEKKITKR